MQLKYIKISNRVNQGLTLVEMLVVIALLLVIITLGAGIFFYNNRFYENQSGEIFSITSTREASDLINEFVRAAVAFEVSYVYNSLVYTTGSQTIILRVPSINAAGDVINQVFDYAIIGQNLGNASRLELILSPDPASSRLPRELLLSDKLTNINFRYDNVDLNLARRVDYDIKVTDIGRSPASEQVFSSATLRNKQ